MVRLLCGILLIFISAGLTAAPESSIELDLEPESGEVYLNSSIILNVVSTGVDRDFSLAALDNLPFQRRETVGGHLRIKDGKWIEYATRRIELTPSQAGTYTIGPITSGSVTSNTVTIRVNALAQEPWDLPEELLQFESSLSTPEPYTQQMIVYEASLSYQHTLVAPRFELPDFEGFRVIKDFAEKRIWHDNGTRSVQWRYLLFPELSGPLTIAPQKVAGYISRTGWQAVAFERQTQGHELQIRPPPIDKGWWLPASRLSLEEDWSDTPAELALGEPVKRRLHVTAEGVTASQLPELSMPQPQGMSLRQVEQQRFDSLEDGILTAHFVLDFELIPDDTKPVFLQSISLPWWDTDQGSLQSALLPPRQVTIASQQRQELLDALAKRQGQNDSFLNAWQTNLTGSGIPVMLIALLSSVLYLLWALVIKPWKYRARKNYPGLPRL